MFFPFTRIHTRRPIYALTGIDIETYEARAGFTEPPREGLHNSQPVVLGADVKR